MPQHRGMARSGKRTATGEAVAGTAGASAGW